MNKPTKNINERVYHYGGKQMTHEELMEQLEWSREKTITERIREVVEREAGVDATTLAEAEIGAHRWCRPAKEGD